MTERYNEVHETEEMYNEEWYHHVTKEDERMAGRVKEPSRNNNSMG
jgi:hypothetical protein